MNRDPAKILVLGHDTAGFSPHPENFIPMPAWRGDPNDESLEKAIDFLEQVAFSRKSDLRDFIAEQRKLSEASGGLLFPASWDASQESAFEQARQARNTLKAHRQQSWLGSFLGKASPLMHTQDRSYVELKRERMESRRKEYAHVRDLMMKQLEAEMAKEKAYYAEHRMSLWDLFSRQPPTVAPTESAK